MEHLEHKHKWYTFGCKDATYLMEKRSFQALTFSEKIQLWIHKLMCSLCRRFEHQSRKINTMFKSAAEESDITLSLQKKQSLNQLITENTKK